MKRNALRYIVIIFITHLFVSISLGQNNVLKVKEIIPQTVGEPIIKINGGTSNNIKRNDSGRIYYVTKEEGEGSFSYSVAKFIVTEVFENEAIIQITGKKKQEIKRGYTVEFIPPLPATVHIQSSPSRADIFVNDSQQSIGVTPKIIFLEPSKKTKITVRKGGWTENSKYFKEPSGVSILDFITLRRIESINGTLIINSTPDGADVFLNDRENPVDKTPMQKSLPAGQYKISLKMEGREPQERVTTLSAGMKQIESFILPEKITFTLQIDTDPVGTIVHINDEQKISPFEIKLKEAKAIILIEKEGYKKIEEEFTLVDQITAKTYELEPLKTNINIITYPPNAEIYIDKVYQGNSPMKVLLSRNIKHKFRINKEGYEVKEEDIKIGSTEQNEINFTLKELGYGYLEIFVYPKEAAIEIDGKLLKEKVPPVKTERVVEGLHEIKFIFEDGTEIPINKIVKRGQTKKVNFNINDYLKSRYRIFAPTKTEIRINNNSIGETPPVIEKKVKAGKYEIRYILKEKSNEYLWLTIYDIIKDFQEKRIHLNPKMSSFSDLKIENNIINDPNNNVFIISNSSDLPIRISIDNRSTEDIPAHEKKTIKVTQKLIHEFKFDTRDIKKCKINIEFFRMREKKSYNITLTIETNSGNYLKKRPSVNRNLY